MMKPFGKAMFNKKLYYILLLCQNKKISSQLITFFIHLNSILNDKLSKIKTGDKDALNRISQNVKVSDKFQADNFDLGLDAK